MRIDLMRKLDTWLGIPITYLLSFLAKKAPSLWGEKIEIQTSKKVLVTKFMGLGSTVLASTLITSLEKAGKSIVFVTFKDSEEFIQLLELHCEVRTIRRGFFTFTWDTLKTLVYLRRMKLRLSIDLEPSANFSAFFHFVSGAKHRLGFMTGKPTREKLFTHLISYSSERHLTENYDLFLKRLEIEKKSRKTKTKKRKEKIYININASELSLHRLWEENKWVALSEKLLKKFPKHELIFTGVKSEENRIRKITTLLRQRAGLSSRVGVLLNQDLLTLTKKIEEAAVVLSVDSFMLHFAEWCGTPVVGLYGPESPVLSGPRRPDSQACYLGLSCSPCLSVLSQKKSKCRDNQCMKQLGVEEVYRACIEVMEKSHAEAA